MPARRRFHFLVYRPGSDVPDWFAANPLYWYPSLAEARRAAQEFACAHDRGVRVDILNDGEVVEQVRPCSD
jgi:hypothetical protein